MAPGALKEKELQQFADEETKKWTAAMVVEDAQFHCHRQLPATEATAKGSKVRRSGLLKILEAQNQLKRHNCRLKYPFCSFKNKNNIK